MSASGSAITVPNRACTEKNLHRVEPRGAEAGDEIALHRVEGGRDQGHGQPPDHGAVRQAGSGRAISRMPPAPAEAQKPQCRKPVHPQRQRDGKGQHRDSDRMIDRMPEGRWMAAV
jgi:hypothetical protein